MDHASYVQIGSQPKDSSRTRRSRATRIEVIAFSERSAAETQFIASSPMSTHDQTCVSIAVRNG